MELTEDEEYELGKNRVDKILLSKQSPVEIAEVAQTYTDDFKTDLEEWREVRKSEGVHEDQSAVMPQSTGGGSPVSSRTPSRRTKPVGSVKWRLQTRSRFFEVRLVLSTSLPVSVLNMRRILHSKTLALQYLEPSKRSWFVFVQIHVVFWLR